MRAKRDWKNTHTHVHNHDTHTHTKTNLCVPKHKEREKRGRRLRRTLTACGFLVKECGKERRRDPSQQQPKPASNFNVQWKKVCLCVSLFDAHRLRKMRTRCIITASDVMGKKKKSNKLSTQLNWETQSDKYARAYELDNWEEEEEKNTKPKGT